MEQLERANAAECGDAREGSDARGDDGLEENWGTEI